MKIAIASGKGGTGKTTVATNLARLLSLSGHDACYVDCDVEAPNGHIFLRPDICDTRSVGIPVPRVDAEKCTGCGDCGEICQFSAIVCIRKKVLTFHELCHGCGGCSLVCPTGAITEAPREIGVVEVGKSDGLGFVHGKLNIGERMAPPLIREVKKSVPPGAEVIIDAPPGTSCPVIESVKGADYVVLVTEPTPFGLNDLKLAVEMTRQLGLPFGIVINRANIGDDRVREYASNGRIRVLLEIPEDRRLAEAYSRGQIALGLGPEYTEKLALLWENILHDVLCKTAETIHTV